MFLPTNEFTVSMPNPVKNPNVVALKLTGKSKRNLIIKLGMLLLVLLVGLPYVSGFIDGFMNGTEEDSEEDQTLVTPQED